MGRTKGFTLLEVMVAMAVLAIAGISLLKSLGEHASSIGYLERKTYAAWLADNQMTELQLSGEFPGTSIQKKNITYADFDWRVEIQGVATVDERLRAVDIRVYETNAKTPITALRSYVAP